MKSLLASAATAGGLFVGSNIDDRVVLAVLNASSRADGPQEVANTRDRVAGDHFAGGGTRRSRAGIAGLAGWEGHRSLAR